MSKKEKDLESAVKAYLGALEFDTPEMLRAIACGCDACRAMVVMYALVTEGVEIVAVEGDVGQGGNLH